MDTPIHYVTTSDGCAIAYSVSGSGPALVYLQPYSHQQMDQKHPVIGPWYRRIARHHTLVRLDARGFGLSDRDPAKVSIEGHVLDVEAVVERLGLERFALMGVSGQGFTAVSYAARHPERASRLVAWSTPAAPYTAGRTPAILALADIDVELTFDAQARWIGGDIPSETWRWGDYIRSVTDIAALRAYLAALAATDVTGQLSAVRCPSLVVHPARQALLKIADTRDLASGIPECEFIVAESLIYPHLGPEVEANARIIERFLGVHDDETVEPPSENGHGGGPVPRSADAKLSEREVEVLKLVAAGRTNQQIADELVISVNTVARHVTHIFEKIDVSNRSQAVAFALRSGIAE